MPYKYNEERRHHIKKMKFHVTNWREYDAALRQRGSLTFWVDQDALSNWQSTGKAGQARYSDLAIQASLTLRSVFKLGLRQAEGLMASVIDLMGLPLMAPDHTTISRRSPGLNIESSPTQPKGSLDILIDSTGMKVYGAGQWLENKHGKKSARRYRKLHLAVDSSGRIISQTLTDEHADDPSQVAPLLDQIQANISSLCADGAYDRRLVYHAIAHHSPGASVLIPPRKDAVLSTEVGPPTKRDLHRQSIEQEGRLKWQNRTGYGKRSLVETTMGR